MMATKINQQLFSLLLLLFLFLLIPLSSSQPDHFLYSGFKNADAKNITLNGIAEIEKNGVLRLTNETSRLMGHAFYPSPFHLKDKASGGKVLSFSTCFALAIVPEYPKLGGHGLAFTIATSKDLKAHPSQYLGLLNPDDVGLLASSHYILGWSFRINGPAPVLDLADLPQLPGPKKKHKSLIIGVSTLISVLVLCGVAIGVYLFRKMKNADVIEAWELEIGPHRYSYQELKKATRGFRDKELLGQGGFGRVYKGTLPNSRTQVAVKRISHESKQGLREFVSEIASIGRLRHRNLVQLLGWCRRRGDLLLVYDFMANGSLDKYLFDEPKIVLNWEQRFKIIKGVASALLYLHEGYEQVVIHRDVKASNVMLDSEMNGRLGDFGLARLYEHGANPSTTRVVGTLGYLAPELPRTGRATTSSDVFAFGALLLEVACGRRPIEPKALPEELVLVDCLWEKFKEGRILDMVDPRLNGDFDENEILMVLKLGLICSNDNPNGRPNIRQVMRYLDGEVELPDEMRMHVGSNHEGFDEFLHSLASSSFDTGSYIGTRDMDNSFTSFGYSPQSVTQTRGETR
ncbi:hypothetical protein PIB30_096408 [Stylosanthes scabra]|uniref:Protein kinase domain-containing protein n=1 Tax=Stylosanthes scabra TaxID=79078 RepID=A0ABU6QX81_9FABA|nr:hypothetical protein [Stylosanthes scabra]